jgi:hypothetical protein
MSDTPDAPAKPEPDVARTEATFEITIEYFATMHSPTLSEQEVWNVLDTATKRSESDLAGFDIGAISVRRV